MDVNKYMDAIQGHENLHDQLEKLISADKQNDQVLHNSLINKRDSLTYQLQDKDKELRELSLLEKKLIEKQNIRDITNLQNVIDKRSTYTKFK